MILLLIFGLIGTFAPGWFMACCGIGSSLEEDAGLVWFFRIVGVAMFLIAGWFMVSASLYRGHG